MLGMRIVFILVYMAALIQGKAQAYLVYETAGSVRLKKYPIGAEIRVHLKGEPRSTWSSYTIWNLDLESKCIQVSETYCLPLKELDGFDLTRQGGNQMAKMSGKFLLQWTFFSGVQEATRTLFKPPAPHLGWLHAIVAGTAAVTWAYSKLFLNGQKKLNKRHRLKLIDLKMVAPKS